VKKVLLLIGAGLLMAACSEAPSAPQTPKAPSARPQKDDLTCRSGYIVAYDQYGNPSCVPADGSDASAMSSPTPTSTSTSTTQVINP
jgi:hypothetical protein